MTFGKGGYFDEGVKFFLGKITAFIYNVLVVGKAWSDIGDTLTR
jgi:hypothetical protein